MIGFSLFSTVINGPKNGVKGTEKSCSDFSAAAALLLVPVVMPGPSGKALSGMPKAQYDAFKRKLPLWSSGIYEDHLRAEENFAGAFFIGFDLDGLPHVSAEDVKLALAPYRAFAYTTRRSTEGSMRWR